MTELAVLLNQPQAGTRAESLADGIDPIDSFLEVHPTIGRNELSIFPALEEDIQDPHQQNGLKNQDAAHAVPRLAEVDLAAGHGDEAAANERLQLIEQGDLQAVCDILGQRILNNTITGRHCWRALKKLRSNLPIKGSHNIPQGQQYSRILERLARSMTLPSKQDYESAHCAHRDFPLDYENLFKLVEEMTPDFSCPLDDGQCLDRLLEDMTATSSVMRVGDGIYISKDREHYARRLRSLAARVYRGV